MSEKKPKLVVAGDGGVGKTSIIVRYTKDQFSEGYEPTLEDNYHAKIELENKEVLEIEIADTAGQEDYKALRDKFMAEGDAFLIVYSIIDARSIQMADTLLEQISVLHEGDDFKFVLAGNKCDKESKRQVTQEEGQDLAKKYHGVFLETSALSAINIQEVFQQIGKMLTAPPKEPEAPKAEGSCCVIE
ncbi:RAP1B, member of RAS oncogene family [Histomonas meleagridis]|uniref:RAP1B, member of RAS oncogene family n=1 Tax=Histomonas meleagridis TaxID=135588 RepID=UPI003559B027|nr:RAP1B, member of RAS oncogene family [Histomonas meleagridis]KAH0799898.1 RAP1B, member of RAS oncogene family [Histomonas meleagridis]